MISMTMVMTVCFLGRDLAWDGMLAHQTAILGLLGPVLPAAVRYLRSFPWVAALCAWLVSYQIWMVDRTRPAALFLSPAPGLNKILCL